MMDRILFRERFFPLAKMAFMALSLLILPVTGVFGDGSGSQGNAAASLGSAPAAAELAGLPVVTLDEVLKAAKETGPDIRQADLALEASRLQYKQTEAKNGLSISGSGGYTRNDQNLSQNTTDTGTVTDVITTVNDRTSPKDSIKAGAKASLPSTTIDISGTHSITHSDSLSQTTGVSLGLNTTVWDGYLPGGRSSITVEKGKLTLQGDELTHESTVADTVYQVKQAYYTALSAQRLLAIRESALQQQIDEQQRTEILSQAGKATRLDTAQAAINTHDARIAKVEAMSNFQSARMSLSVLLGWDRRKAYCATTILPKRPMRPSRHGKKTIS